MLTKCVAVAHLGSPASYEMNLVLGNGGHLWVPVTDELIVLFDFVRFNVVEYD
jgi:hypothetical protein